MRYVVIWTFSPQHREAAVARFIETGGNPPDGVAMLSRSHDLGGNRGFAIAETADPTLIARWCREWADLLAFEIVPAINDEELMSILRES